jgi:hypothetical protein
MRFSHTRSVVLSPVTGLRQTVPCYWATVTIQPTPKRSVTMPKHGDQHVLPRGICDAVASCSWRSLEALYAPDGARQRREQGRCVQPMYLLHRKLRCFQVWCVDSCSWEGGACSGTQGTSGKRRGLCASRGLLLPGHHAYRWALVRGVSLGRAARHTPPPPSAHSDGQTGR